MFFAGGDVRPRPTYRLFYCWYRRCPGYNGSATPWGTKQPGAVETFTDSGQCRYSTDWSQEHQDNLPRFSVTRGLSRRMSMKIRFCIPLVTFCINRIFYAQLPRKFVVTFLRPFPHQFPDRLLIKVPSLIYISFPLEFWSCWNEAYIYFRNLNLYHVSHGC